MTESSRLNQTRGKLFAKTASTRKTPGWLFSSVALIGLLVSGSASAQQSTASTAAKSESIDEASKSVEEIIILGIRESQLRSLEIKREAVGVVDAITSSDISSFPGLDISEELQRLPGVTLDRALGQDGRGNVKVRGLPADFTRTVINGQTVTTASEDRQADFSVFPSELFGGAEILKTPHAEFVEGGIAAIVNMKTPRAFDYKERVVRFNLEGEYHGLDNRLDPRISGLYVDKFADDKIGIAIGAAYDEGVLRLDRSNPWRFRTRSHDLDNDGVNEFQNVDNLLLPRNMVDLREQKRLGLMGTLQYQATPDLLFTLNGLFADRKERRQRNSIDGDLQPNPKALELTVIDNVVREGLFANVTQRSEEILRFQNDESLLLNFETDWHFADQWDAFLQLSRSDSSRREDDKSFLVSGVGDFGYSTLADPRFVVFTQSIDALNASSFTLNQARFVPEDVNDEENSGRFDITRSFEDSFLRAVKAGFYVSDREQSRERYDSRITPPAGTVPFEGAIVGTLPVKNLFKGFGKKVPDGVVTNFLIPDPDAILNDPTFFPDGPGVFNRVKNFSGSWQVNETTYSGYTQADFEFGQFVGNAGVRLARTEVTARGFDIVAGEAIPNRIDSSYTDILPAANLRYNLGEDLIFRVAASRAIARPGLAQLSPGRSIATNQRIVTGGNPELDPFEVNQIDFSAEWYFQKGGLLSATAFYKDVKSFIINVTTFEPLRNVEPNLVDDQGDPVEGQIFEFRLPQNGRGGNVKGIELNYQQPFTWLPKPFDGFGVILNYTYAKSQGSLFIGGEEIRTQLANQPKNSANAIAYFETEDFNVRVTYAWVDKFLRTIRDGTRREFQANRGQMDLSAQYNLTRNVSVNFEAINVLNETSTTFDTNPSRPFEFDNIGAVYRLGASLTF